MNNQKTNNLSFRPNNNSSKKNNAGATITNFISSPVESAKSNPVLGLIIGLVLLVVLYVVFNYVYNMYTTARKQKVSTKSLLSASHSGTGEYEVGSSDMASSSYSNEYAMSFWVYVDDFNYRQGQRKFIMRRGSIKSVVNPEIYLHPNDNKLQINVSLMTSGDGTPTTTPTTSLPPQTTKPAGAEKFLDVSTCDCNEVHDPQSVLNEIANNNPNIPPTYQDEYFDLISGNELSGQEGSQQLAITGALASISKENFGTADTKCDCPETSVLETESDRKAFEDKAGKCVVEDFPLQKWVHVVVSQYNQVLDVYIDGKLKSSCVLPGFPAVAQDDLVISPDGGFSGMISKVEYTNSVLSAKDVMEIYSQGPEGKPESFLSSIPTWAWIISAIIILSIIAWTLF